MYQKVQEKIKPWHAPPKDDPKIVPPNERQSFISCPECYGQSLAKCECDKANYICQTCGWTHYTHKHGKPETPPAYEKPPTQLLHMYTLPN